MKFYPNNIEVVLTKIKQGEITSILFFGPDSGMISEFTRKIATSLKANIAEYEINSSASLQIALNNRNFFGDREIIKINPKTLKLDEEIKNNIKNNNYNFPVFATDELDTTNAFRKFFENTQNLAVIGCYPDDEKSAKYIISSILHNAGKQIENDALFYLINHLKGDRNLIRNEMEKLLTYSYNIPKITCSICEKLISSSIEPNPDLLCIYYAKKDGRNFLKQLSIIKDSNINNIWIIRAIARYMQNHLLVKLYQLDGIYIDDAIKKLSPKIFFKYVSEFRDISTKLSLKEISSSLEMLLEAEIKAKTFHAESVLEMLFFHNFMQNPLL